LTFNRLDTIVTIVPESFSRLTIGGIGKCGVQKTVTQAASQPNPTGVG
jgi:hypothetical protein